MRRTLYIFVEVGPRELLSRLTIAEEARQRGYRVVIGEKNLLRNLCWLFRFPPGIILDKCGQIARSAPILSLKSRGFKYVVLDEEGIFYAHQDRLPEPSDLVLFNSAYQRRLAGLEVPASDVVGNPRLHPSSLIPYFQDEILEIRRRYGNFVLICSSFDPRMKSSYAIPEEAQTDLRLRPLFLAAITRLSKTVPIVYRPHPSDGDEFASQVGSLVPVERRFTILPWIAASRLVVNAKCTSSLEALRLGVPSATLSVKSMVHAKISGLSRRFYDVESICDYIERGNYSVNLPNYKRNYVRIISGPENPQAKIVDRLDRVDVPEVSRVRWLRLAGKMTEMANRLSYGQARSSYIQSKYGEQTYPNRFPGFTSHLGGRLIISKN